MEQYNKKEDVLKLGIATQNSKNPPPPMDLSGPIEPVRQIVAAMEKTAYDSCPSFDTQETVIDIPMRDGHQSNLHIVKPGNSSGANPVVVLIFGGAFVMGSNIQSIVWARTIAALYGATVVQPSYRLAPEHKFPTAPNDIWDSVQWIAANASALDADLTKGFVLGGGSAGGNLAIVTAHRAVKEKLSPPITGVLASIPVCMSQETVPEKYKELWVSREQNGYAPGNPGLDAKSVKGYEALYQQDLLSEDFSPFNSTVPFSALPRTYVQVAGLDILRDDGIVYAKVLGDNGVEVRLDAYPGVPHGHFNLWPHLKQSIKSQEDTIWHFGWLLHRPVSRERVEGIVALTRK
ncbi:lipase/esterase [Aspergillus nomiae NRRL 13137]|uniref:Lipase/esterase n=1 Tax=Aspergillus nomiae NRRL (strain ATCC 15546 / NRRL 13137 / CBS 260.88 / M93) TaxID=1509407 RepID=A0A0L1J0Y5_ASPN3|nr:lipase/esterase [Aspergillus nomiae NRRL 13137]KNG85325.1 lipase/esterase [Aspergillus nomiae NRRL 13137]